MNRTSSKDWNQLLQLGRRIRRLEKKQHIKRSNRTRIILTPVLLLWRVATDEQLCETGSPEERDVK